MFGLGLFVGMLIGVPFGVFLIALCKTAARGDDILESRNHDKG